MARSTGPARRGEESRAEDVDAHAARRELAGDVAGVVHHRRLGGGVGEDLGERLVGGDAADVEDRAAASGVKFVLEPGGSTRDDSMIQAANEYGMTMIFSGVRLFHH